RGACGHVPQSSRPHPTNGVITLKARVLRTIIGTLTPRVQDSGVLNVSRLTPAPVFAHQDYGVRGGGFVIPNLCRSARIAACHPFIPCTPGPGGVDDEHKYTPGM